jgi:hypothetical protein
MHLAQGATEGTEILRICEHPNAVDGAGSGHDPVAERLPRTLVIGRIGRRPPEDVEFRERTLIEQVLKPLLAISLPLRCWRVVARSSPWIACSRTCRKRWT